jgi:hypothetical protein
MGFPQWCVLFASFNDCSASCKLLPMPKLKSAGVGSLLKMLFA